MINNGKLVLLAALMIPGAAFAQINVGDTVGSTEAAVRSALEASGYAVLEIEVEDDEIEAEVTLDGTAYEIEVSAASGMVLEIEVEDDDESEDS
jgi:uncharacterized membrane protein YkoI